MFALAKPEVICTHESDLDGFVSGLLLLRLAKQLFGAEPRLEAYQNQSWRSRSPAEQTGWICDFAFERRFDKLGWVIIDHHPAEAVPAHALLIHDLSKSASLLCYDLCRTHGIQSPALDRLVHLSNVADLFLESDPDFHVANDYANLVKNYGFWNLHQLINGELESLLDHPLLEVMAVKRRVENPLGYAWSKRNITELSPTVAFVDTILGNVNWIVHQLLEEEATPYPVLLTLFRKGNGRIIVSLRSKHGEALPIAERLQGGGHANACGASLPRSIQDVSEAVQYLKQLLNPSRPRDREDALNSLEAAFEALNLPPR